MISLQELMDGLGTLLPLIIIFGIIVAGAIYLLRHSEKL